MHTATVIGAMAMLVAFSAPERITFALSRPAMDRLVQRVRANPQSVPRVSWVGLYPVSRIEAIPGGMRFAIAGAGILGGGGFAYFRSGPPPQLGGNFYTPRGDNWYTWFESW